jgi:hypothetical protein
MANKKLKEKKKKAREKLARARVLHRRDLKRKKDKIEAEMRAEEMKKMPKMEPYMKDETKKRKTQEQLEHNMKILEALEEEYEKEKAGRQDANDQLEAEGFQTLEERIAEIQRRIGENQNKMNILEGTGTANFGYEVQGGIGGMA